MCIFFSCQVALCIPASIHTSVPTAAFWTFAASLACWSYTWRIRGQTVLAEAEAPVKLTANDNVTRLDNTHPQKLRSPPLRRLREEAYGEFQYPNKYLEFPVPMGTKRKLRFKVISSDGGHFGYYQLNLARQECSTEMPLFDVRAGHCVRFCNLGYWADFHQSRCKRCPELCVSCVSRQRCLSCHHPTLEMQYVLDTVSGQCTAKVRTFLAEECGAGHLDCVGRCRISAVSLWLIGLCLGPTSARCRSPAEIAACSRWGKGKWIQPAAE